MRDLQARNPRSKPPAPIRRPPFHDHFLFRKEVDRIGPLRMEIPEKALLPSRKWKVSHGGRNTEVNADISRSDFMTELACRASAARKQAGHVSVSGTVDQFDCLVERIRTNDAQHRSEHFSPREVA